MKKLLSICLITSVLILAGCKKDSISTTYTIGCLGYSTGTVESNWTGFEHYMSSVAAYNKSVTFSNETAEENDTEAKKYYQDQLAKINADSACSYIGGSDYLIYGIATGNGSKRVVIKSVKFTTNGMADYQYNGK